MPRRAEPISQTLVPVPSRFFVTSGKGINKTSELNAFDLALLQAGIGEQNLVSVSSVLPIGIRQTDRVPMARGAITHCVLARHGGGEGEVISAGIAYGFRTDGQGGTLRGASARDPEIPARSSSSGG